MAMIHEALVAIGAEVPAVTKDKRNQQQGFQYRGIDDVYAAIHPLFTKYGVFSVPTVETDRSEERTTKNGSALIYRILKVRYDFYAKDGSSLSATVMGEGMDSGDKASNKALAVAHKYALLQILSIPVDEVQDPDSETHNLEPRNAGPIPPPEPPRVPLSADPRIDLIKGILSALTTVEEEYDALKREVWDTHRGNLDEILKDLEVRQLQAAHKAKKAKAPAPAGEIF